MLARFLFLFQDPIEGAEHGDHLTDPRGSFVLMSGAGREALLDELMGVLRAFGPLAAWRVAVSTECAPLREWCFQEDVALELPDRFLLIHLGVSD